MVDVYMDEPLLDPAPALTEPSVQAPSTLDWAAEVHYLRGLASVVEDLGLTDLEVEHSGVRWTLSTRSVPAGGQLAVAVADEAYAHPARPSSAVAPRAPAAEPTVAVVSPMVGVFYRAPSPNDPHFVEVGDKVEVGQTVGLVEAMKVFNEIIAESEGIVVEISAHTGQLVETGVPLILLRRA